MKKKIVKVSDKEIVRIAMYWQKERKNWIENNVRLQIIRRLKWEGTKMLWPYYDNKGNYRFAQIKLADLFRIIKWNIKR